MALNVAYAINEPYVDYCIVSMLSVVTNNSDSEIDFHILTDGLSDNSKTRLRQTVNAHSTTNVIIHEIADSKVADLELGNFNRNIWLRVFLPELLDVKIERVLYLDTDTIICGDISELFSMDLENSSIAASMDIMGFYDTVYQRLDYPKEYGYICSGVMIMNLKYFRDNNLTCKILEYARKYPQLLLFPDQDAINAVCHTTLKLLPLKYDMLAPFFTDSVFIRQHETEVRDMLTDPRIIHYAGCNPWKKETRAHHFHENEFWKYASMGTNIKRRWSKRGMALLKHVIMMTLGQCGIQRYKAFRYFQRPDFSTVSKLQRLSD